MRIIYRFILFVLTCLSIEGYAQTSDWTETAAPKSFQVIIPDSVAFSLPTTDTYKIGFFVYGSDDTHLINVGQAEYTPGVKTIISLGFDASGLTGYAENERLISLLYNNATTEVYGVEFNYVSGKNKYISNDSTVVRGIKMGTWMDFLKGKTRFCRFEKEWVLQVPYGILPHLMYSNGFVVDSSGAYPVLKLSVMNPGVSYTFQFFYPEVKFTKVLYGFILEDFPIQYLNSSYQICPGDTITLPSSYENGALSRGTSQYGGRTLTKEGVYAFPIFYHTNGCNTLDTVVVTMKEFPLDKINQTYFICPGDLIEVPVLDTESQLSRELVDAPGFSLITPGTYVYKATQLVSGCVLNDTIQVEHNNINCQKLSYASLIDPVHGEGLVLPLDGKVVICNAALEKIVELNTPAIWYGTDSSGGLLPVGVYYIVHENGTTSSVSIIY